ncbi:cytochrome P450 10-like [Dendronephthya gigantea]|uniref:cytochrome P450 10-like n=1 Tax=Dendronephthya gigantea TaxID=151771 RepID=UPI001068F3A1|nr:cytochrome P450 10-like [Dendronephthya gigantea]
MPKIRSFSESPMLSNNTETLPFSAIPGPRGTVSNILGYTFSKGTHFDKVKKRFQKFGPIYREKVLDMDIVNIYDVDSLAKVLNTGVNFQLRPGAEAIMEIFGRNISGITSCDYNEWYPDRSLLSPMFLRPKEIHKSISMINAVANDFVERLHQLRDQDGTIKDIEKELSY